MENINELVIYGAGKLGKAYIDKCLSCGLTRDQLCCTDSNRLLWGKNYRGLEIQNPDIVLTDTVDMVVIAVGYKYKEEVMQQLKDQYHIADNRITYHTETLLLPKCEMFWAKNVFFANINENMFERPQYYDMWYELYKTALKRMNIGTGGGV